MESIQLNISRRVSLPANQTSSNINANILNALRKQIEGRNISAGYVKSVNKIINRKNGKINIDKLNGQTDYDILVEVSVISIKVDDIIYDCEVKFINNKNIFLVNDFININIQENYLPSFLIGKIKQGDKLNIRVLGVNCPLGNDMVEVLGVVHYYSLPNVDKLTVELPELNSLIEGDKMDLFEEDLFETKNNIPQTDLGFNEKIITIKRLIENISSNVWLYYRNLLNPFELIFSGKTQYITYEKNIPSRSYFKLWDILNHFKILNSIKVKNVLNLCEAPGGFVKALIDYNDEHEKLKCTYDIVTLDIGVKFNKELQSNKNVNINLNESIDGNIINYNNYETFNKKNKGVMYDLITADGGWFTDNKFNQEKDLFSIKFSEFCWAILKQADGGVFIWKVFDIYTSISMQMIYVLSLCYERVYIYKPIISRLSNSEKYIVCIGRKNNTNINSVIGKIWKEYKHNTIYDNIIKVNTEFNKNPLYSLWKKMYKNFNNEMLYLQWESIKNILTMIQLNNEEYLSKEKEKEYLIFQEKYAIEYLNRMEYKNYKIEK